LRNIITAKERDGLVACRLLAASGDDAPRAVYIFDLDSGQWWRHSPDDTTTRDPRDRGIFSLGRQMGLPFDALLEIFGQ